MEYKFCQDHQLSIIDENSIIIAILNTTKSHNTMITSTTGGKCDIGISSTIGSENNNIANSINRNTGFIKLSWFIWI